MSQKFFAMSDYDLAFKGGPDGLTIQQVLQQRLHYDASRFTAALRAMCMQTEPEVLEWQHLTMQKEVVSR